ncbi:MAG: hypothetical protein JKX68_08125 [Flavobacteriales bacterium]|nr:hypothetical protein [Flavobacteriales bacterium]
MADIVIASDLTSSADQFNACRGVYWLDEDIGIVFHMDGDTDVSFARTINAGTSWAITEIQAGDSLGMAVWYDKETDDTGDLVHVVWWDSGTENLLYCNVDISDGSVSTIVTVANYTGTTTRINNRFAITKARNGNLILSHSSAATDRTYKSTDGGTNWTSITAIGESNRNPDYLLFFPANTGDDADIASMYWDASSSEISIKMYDDSANTWTETSVSTSMSFDTVFTNWDGALRHSDGHIIFAAHTNNNHGSDDLKVWDLTVDSISSPTVTAKTNIFTNVNDAAQAAVIINQQNDDVYIAYIYGSGWTSSTNIYYKLSTNGGTSWGTEVPYGEDTDDDNRLVAGARSIGSSGGRIMWAWYDDDNTQIETNLNNDILIEASGGTIEELAGTSTSSSTTTGDLTISLELSATSNGSSTTTGDLTVSLELSSTSSGTSTTSGNIIFEPLEISGQSVSSSTTTGNIVIESLLSGTSSGSSITSANATIESEISSVSTSSSATTGNINIESALSGASNGSSITTGNASIISEIAGTSASSSTTSGDVSISVLLSGLSSGSTTTTGNIISIIELSSVSNGSSSTVGNITIESNLSGVSNGASTTSGDLIIQTTETELSGTSSGSSVTSGNLTSIIELSATSNGTSTTSGNIVIELSLSGTSAGSSTTAGDATITVAGAELSGTSSGSSVTTGNITIESQLSGVSIGSSTTSGDITIIQELSGTSNGASITSGDLALQDLELSGVSVSTSTTTGNLVLESLLQSLSIGQSITSGDIEVIISLSGTTNGFSTTSGSLVIANIESREILKIL